MFTLLPQEKRKDLIREYRMRLLFIGLSMFAVLGAIGATFLLPTYFSVRAQVNDISFQRQTIEKAIAEKSDQNLEKTLSELKQNIRALGGTDRDMYPVIGNIVEEKPAGVSITKFSYTFNAGGKNVLTVEGIADSRKNLLLFSKNLENHKEFSTVDLPISNLAKDTNIQYRINLLGDF